MNYELCFFEADEDGEPTAMIREGVFKTEAEAFERLNSIGSERVYPHAYIWDYDGEVKVFYAN